jgi:hypothetical protein
MSTPDWWGNWRPSLPAHTGDLQPTDLIECTMMSGGVPTNTVITGQQIIDAAQGGGGSTSWGNIGGTLSNQTDLQTALNAKQATLVSGTNIKTVNGNSLVGSGNLTISSNPITLASLIGSNLIGTANQISASYRIAGGTLVANNSIFINDLLTKTAGSTTSTARIYINTTNSLTGATLIGTASAMTSTTYIQRVFRTYYFNGTHLFVYNPTSQLSTDVTAGTITLVPFNPAIDYFLIFAVQNSTTTPDNLGHKRVIVQLYD